MSKEFVTIADEIQIDWSDQLLVRNLAKQLGKDFKAKVPELSYVNRQAYRGDVPKSTFLMPLFINWRKYVDAPTLLESSTISDKRKKIVRQAISQSEKNGISYQVINPLGEKDFLEFLQFYRQFNEEMNYDLYLDHDYFQKYDPQKLFMIMVVGADGHFYGGRIIKLGDRKIGTDFRSIERTKLVKEGFDTVCEKIYFDLAVQHKAAFMTRGQELNVKGIGNRSLGMLWNKLKWGYKPFLFSHYPRLYVDFSFLKSVDFDLVFFVSIENEPDLFYRKDEKVILNFICGKNPDWNEIQSVKEKSMYQVRVWDMDFNLVERPVTS